MRSPVTNLCREAGPRRFAGKPSAGLVPEPAVNAPRFTSSREVSDRLEGANLWFHVSPLRQRKPRGTAAFGLPLRSQTASSPRKGPTAPAHRPSQRPHCAGPVASAAPAAGPVPGAASESPGWAGHSGSWPLAGWRPPGSCSCGSSGRPGPGSPTGCGPWRSEPGSYLKRRGEKKGPHWRGGVAWRLEHSEAQVEPAQMLIPRPYCGTLGNLLSVWEPQLPHLYNGNTISISVVSL